MLTVLTVPPSLLKQLAAAPSNDQVVRAVEHYVLIGEPWVRLPDEEGVAVGVPYDLPPGLAKRLERLAGERDATVADLVLTALYLASF